LADAFGVVALIVQTVAAVERTAMKTDERGNSLPVGLYAVAIYPDDGSAQIAILV